MTTRMITCCPACSTLFKVTPEQLRIADGWVRCGQCMVLFDARARMLPADPYVPSDLDWREEAGTPDDTPPPDLTEDTAHADEPQAVAGQAVDLPAAEAETVAPAPELGRTSPAAESPVFDKPAFELKPPPAPEKPAPVPMPPVSMPVFAGKAPIKTVTFESLAAGQTLPVKATASRPPLPIPTRDELDRRYAKLLETLARLRENAEKRNNEHDDLDTRFPDDEDLSAAAPDSGQGSRPQRQTSRSDAARADRRHAAATEQESAHQRERPDARRDQEHGQKFGEAPAPRPMIDPALSEIGEVPPPASAPVQSSLEQPAETRPAEPAVPSFVEQARRRAFWGLPQVRAGLWVAAGVLTLMLAAQIAVNQRDRLAAQHPGALPLLQALCRPARCQIAAWRHLGAVTIDSSAFVRTGADGFGFAVTLRNSGAAPVATPALELALIDAHDQPLARRVLNPADWGAPPQLAAHGEFNGAARLTVLDAAHPQAVSNYRLTAFYP